MKKSYFLDIEDYVTINELLEKTGTKAWVNCVRRSLPYTKRLQELFSHSKEIHMHVSGNLWGIGCNTIHYVDWICAITKSYLIPVFDISKLDNEILASKRPGYVEFKGSLFAKLGLHSLQLTSYKGIFNGFDITIEDEKIKYTLHEVGDKGTNVIYDKLTGEKLIEEYEYPCQSNLTNRVISSLLIKKVCPLVEYEQSMRQHIPMIEAFLKKIGTSIDYCNIT